MNEVTIIFWKNTPSTNKITLSHRITGTKGYIYTIRNGGYFPLRAITASMQARIFGAPDRVPAGRTDAMASIAVLSLRIVL